MLDVDLICGDVDREEEEEEGEEEEEEEEKGDGMLPHEIVA